VAQVLARVEDGVAMPAQVRGRAHAVEEECEGLGTRARVEAVARGVHADVRRAAPFKLREERAEPIGVLVVNGYRRLLV
jgi:hypothetical protein